MKKMIIIVLLLVVGVFVSACSTPQSSNTNTQQELNQLREEVNQMKLNEKAKEMEGGVLKGLCSQMGSDLECPCQGNWCSSGDSISCIYSCVNGDCVRTECKVR